MSEQWTKINLQLFSLSILKLISFCNVQLTFEYENCNMNAGSHSRKF